MESSLLLHITHAIIPLASQCASSVIRLKQTLLLAASGSLWEREYLATDILTFIAHRLWSLQQIMHWILCLYSLKHVFFLFHFPQNQAEAHYKGHKHARKLKAMESQKNRQRRGGENSTTGKERDRDRSKASSSDAALQTPMDTSIVKETSRFTESDMLESQQWDWYL